ncbi:PTS system cellobiose-specific IIC component [Scopulibacillus darangshiensis]|uniref:Permease IIC component n=1 Tax=Scopulibacillus darangshiensis TaxID=442528 RepID=A0A4R2P8F7_9BACL|nr:PTS transporter subunit EIIC [Scopulibacillus darangshiensis]TCP31212.1 PTS system cellobiose-specific IIC component [Scopulibacillus darangshiensis]
MNTFINWMNQNFTPKMNKITRNVWVSSIQDAIMAILPLILVGSLITLISILNNYFSRMPDFSPISTFSFGLISIFIALLTPYFIMEKKKKNDRKIISGLTGVSLFLMLLMPKLTSDGGITFKLERFGGNGMFVALFVGLIVGLVMYLFSKFSFFKNSSSLPDFIIVWFDTIIPITLLLFCGWLFTFQMHLDLYDLILKVFQPISFIAQSFTGFVLITFIGIFLYSFGISAWVLYPIMYPVWLEGIRANAKALAHGLHPHNIHTFETLMAWVWVGGMGTTLPLVLMMLFFAKSNQLKAIGKVTIIPGIFNINEPCIFGAPVAFNPILMVPMWLNGLIIPAITYIVLNLGWVTIPAKLFQLWYMPVGISTFLVNSDVRGMILLVIVMVVSWLIWFPFFKVYDLQQLKTEQEQ